MSHALLLRLFLSPYFSMPVAMHYLKTYPDSIGISHYLCWRMKSMPADEVEFYWPQICHLLLTYPTPSNALESFILSRAEESTHSAMLTFWFMQAALHDLTPTRQTNPRPFLICQRVLHRCHEVIFGDPPEPSRSPYRSLPHSPPASSSAVLGSKSMDTLRTGSMPSLEAASRAPLRVNPHVPPSLVGMGSMIAAMGMPGLATLAGEWAVIQGRKTWDEDSETRTRVEVEQGGGADLNQSHVRRKTSGGSDSDEDDRQQSRRTPHSAPLQSRAVHPRSATSPHPASTTPDLRSTPAHTPLRSPLLNSSPSPVGSPRMKGEDPFSQQGAGPSTPPPHPSHPTPKHSPFSSVPELSASSSHHASALRRLNPNDRTPTPESLLATYSIDAQRQLLRSHYCRSQIRFLLLLEDISNRLVVIPKLARVSALRAELTGINHNLPAEVCIPMWCAADHSHEEGGQTSTANTTPFRGKIRGEKRKGHSRVVRISPGDSVVLNSAERAPFLLHVEILEGDLDFDPTRRENRDLLKKIVIQEDLRRRKKDLGMGDSAMPTRFEGFGSPMPEAPPEQVLHVEEERVSPPKLSRKDTKPEEVEEMDLVEQLYGAKLSVKDVLPDMSETLPYSNGPKNKALDVLAWDRGDASRRNSFTPNMPSGSFQGSPGNASPGTALLGTPASDHRIGSPKPVITLEDYSERMRTAAVMLAQLNASQVPTVPEGQPSSAGGALSWIPGTGWIKGGSKETATPPHSMAETPAAGQGGKLKLAAAQAAAIRERIMEEMMSLEEERVARMTDRQEGEEVLSAGVGANGGDGSNTAEDEGIVRRELNKADPSAAIFKESWTAKKSRIRSASPWGHLANWDVISVIVKTGTDLRQEQLATQLIERFSRIFKEEKSDCWVRFFRILITGEQSGLVETITDAVSVHSIKKGEYARRIAEGGPIGKVSLMDHFVNTYGKPDSGRFARAQRNFIKSLAGYSIVTFLLQIKDRHNGNILVDRDGHLIHIDFGFMLSNSPGGNMGFEAAPFKMPLDYVEIMGGLDSAGYAYFKKLFKEGFEAARKHSDSLLTIVELMQKDSKLDCFLLFGQQTTQHFRDRFALGLTTQAVDAYLERLIVSSTGSNYTRLYDTFQYYSQGVL